MCDSRCLEARFPGLGGVQRDGRWYVKHHLIYRGLGSLVLKLRSCPCIDGRQRVANLLALPDVPPLWVVTNRAEQTVKTYRIS